MTITEALAEIKTIQKRLISKRSFVEEYLVRVDMLKDPFEKDGGSYQTLERELQGIYDLEDRHILLRGSIQKANDETTITVEGVTKTISDWLVWRRDIAVSRERFINRLRQKINSARNQLTNNPWNKEPNTAQPTLVVNVDEQELAKEAELIQNILGQLDGQLSLKNATVTI